MNNVNKSEERSREKRPYESPEIKVFIVELEHSIATGSAAKASPNNNLGEVKEEWEVGQDDVKTIEW